MAKYNLRSFNKLFIIIFFSFFLIYGLLTVDNYGISSDEPTQRYHSLVTYNELFLKNQTYVTETIDTTKLPDLSEYGANYGTILQLPLVFIEHLFDFTLSYDQIFLVRHIYTFLWFFVASIFFYKIGLVLTQNRLLAWIGTLMFILSPRILADSFYNIKDSLCMSLFTISMYFGLKLLRSINWKDAILFVIFSVLCTTSRIIGGVIVFSLVLLLVCKSIFDHTWKKYWKYFLAVCIAFIACFALATPKSWGNLLSNIYQTILTFMNYTTWDGNVYYMGQTISGTDLPWHYLFVWIGITVPGLYCLFALMGIFSSVRESVLFVRQRLLRSAFWTNLFLLLLLLIPFGYVVVFRPVLYHGWRHFFFIYPVIISFSLLGLAFVLTRFKKKNVQYALLSLFAIVFISTGVWIIQNRGHEYLYFNPWIRSYAMDNFELDYWYLTEAEHLDYIRKDMNEESNDAEILVHSNEYAPYRRCFTFDQGILSPQLTDDYNQADYVISWGEEFPRQYLFVEENPIWVNNTKISSVYRRSFDVVTNFEIFQDEDSLYCNVNNANWKIQEDSSSLQINISLDTIVPTDLIAVFPSDSASLTEISILASADGNSWYSLTDSAETRVGTDYLSVPCLVHDLQNISISIPADALENGSLKIALCRYQEDISSTDNTGLLSIESIQTNVEGISPVRYMIDSDETTRWTSPPQSSGMYIQFNFLEPEFINAAQLSLGESPWDSPSDLQISASLDGETWVPVDYVTQPDNQTYFFSAGIECQHIRFELGEGNSTASNWSVYEAQFFTELPSSS